MSEHRAPIKRQRIGEDPHAAPRRPAYLLATGTAVQERPYTHETIYVVEEPSVPLYRQQPVHSDLHDYNRLLKKEAATAESRAVAAERQAEVYLSHVRHYRDRALRAEGELVRKDQHIGERELEHTTGRLRRERNFLREDCEQLRARAEQNTTPVVEAPEPIAVVAGSKDHDSEENAGTTELGNPTTGASTTRFAEAHYVHEMFTFLPEDTIGSYEKLRTTEPAPVSTLPGFIDFRKETKRKLDVRAGDKYPSFHVVQSVRPNNAGKFFIMDMPKWADWLKEVAESEWAKNNLVLIKPYVANPSERYEARVQLFKDVKTLNDANEG